jgi:hypothetical protein
MWEYCLGLGWGALAVGLVHYVTSSNFWTIDRSMLWLEPARYLADKCNSSCSILSNYVLGRSYVCGSTV